MVFELTQLYFSSVAGNLLQFWWVWDWIGGDMQYDCFEVVSMNTVPVGTVWLVQDLSLSHNLELTVILCSPVWYDVVLLLPVKMIKQNDFPRRMSHDKHREHVSWRLMWSCHIIFHLYEWHICINMTHHTVVTYRKRAPCCSENNSFFSLSCYSAATCIHHAHYHHLEYIFHYQTCLLQLANHCFCGDNDHFIFLLHNMSYSFCSNI